MKGYKPLALLVLMMLCVVLLAACGEQAAEDTAIPQLTTEATQPQAGDNGDQEEGELPAVTIPPETEPVTDGENEPDLETEPTEPTKQTESANIPEETQPPVVTEPSQEPEPTEPTQPETTQPTELPGMDEDELPLIPFF